MSDIEFRLIENLLTKHYNALEQNIDTIARRAALAVVHETLPSIKEDLKNHLNETMAKIVADKSKETVFIVTGEDLDDKGRCSVLRNAVQWAIRSANKSSIVMRTVLTAGTSSIIGAIIAMLIKK